MNILFYLLLLFEKIFPFFCVQKSRKREIPSKLIFGWIRITLFGKFIWNSEIFIEGLQNLMEIVSLVVFYWRILEFSLFNFFCLYLMKCWKALQVNWGAWFGEQIKVLFEDNRLRIILFCIKWVFWIFWSLLLHLPAVLRTKISSFLSIFCTTDLIQNLLATH